MGQEQPYNEEILLSAARQGDLEAFNQIVLAYQDQVFNVAYRIVLDEDAASDAAQNAFIAAYRKLNSFQGGSFRAWLLRITTNLCLDELRRLKRHPVQPLEPTDVSGEEDMENARWLADPQASPEERVMQRELENAVRHCVEELPADFRTVVVLVDMQGMDYEETASAVGKPLGTIKSRLARARERLQDCLRDFGELLPSAFRLKGEGRNDSAA
jgi:RNA polymerase sigma-70 factor (ECF subfamily)